MDQLFGLQHRSRTDPVIPSQRQFSELLLFYVHADIILNWKA